MKNLIQDKNLSLQESPPLETVLIHALNKQSQYSVEISQLLAHKLEPLTMVQDFSSIWPPSAYHLQSVTVFQQASEDIQKRVLHALGRNRLLEAYGIENAGMSFAAKMSLLAESLEEQMLYSCFAAEEALHFQWIRSVLGPLPQPYRNVFIDFLHQLIQTGTRRPLQLMIQILLEGWGLDHYTRLMKTCQLDPLTTYFQKILQDEASHHGSGLALFSEVELASCEERYILDVMFIFLNMIRIGPVGLLNTLEVEFGGFTELQRTRILEEMQAKIEIQRQLSLMRKLLQKAGAVRILASLDARQGFSL